MLKAKKILITTESREVFILRTNSRSHALGMCRSCGCEVGLLTLDQAVSESGLRTGVLVQIAEEGRIHTIETQTGHLIFCHKSITAVFDRGK
jgi:hypothetical protein